MKPSLHPTPRPAALRALAAAVALGAAAAAHAQLTDLSNVPLQTSVSTTVRPNLMYILDASGSMAGDFLPDYVTNSVGGNDKAYCRDDDGVATPTSDNNLTECERGDVPFYAAAFNGNYYNPQVTYLPPPMPAGWLPSGTDFKPQTAANTVNWTQVFNDPFTNPGQKDNIVTKYRELYACKNNSYNAADCSRSGINTPNPFNYWTQGLPNNNSNSDNRVLEDNSNPHYFDIIPQEHCSDLDLSNCTASTTPTGVFAFPAHVRFCQTLTQSTQAATPTGGTPPQCIGRYINQGTGTKWRYARYGRFQRVDIKPSTPTYGNRPSRNDCLAAPTCSYAEEMTNFANWYAYYRTRMQMMKSASGHAFIDLDDRYRIGFITIRPGNTPGNTVSGSNPVSPNRFQPIQVFDNAQKLLFFQKLYAQNPTGNTPLREALSRVGRYFAKQSGGINSGMSDDPVEYSCQQNFALLTTDGYWNDAAGVNLTGAAMGNVDNTNTGYAQRSDGAYDGNVAGSSGTLADVALYYYQTDLRTAAPLGNCTSGSTSLDICQNNVATSPADANDTQHMTTFTLGLVDGLMRYQTDYDTATNSDVAKIKSSSTGCPWSPTSTCNWPVPVNDQQSAIDDLWHAAVNGRGKYYNARDPETLAFGLKNALSNVVSQTAAAAAAATSTPNINQFDNFVFSSTYRTVTWDGEVIARNIDTATGNVIPTVVWSAQTQLDAVAPASRKIYVRNGTSSRELRLRDPARARCRASSPTSARCSRSARTLSLAQQTTVNNGTALVNYLRGDKTERAGHLPAARPHPRRHGQRRPGVCLEAAVPVRRSGVAQLRRVQGRPGDTHPGPLRRRERRHAARLQRDERPGAVGVRADDGDGEHAPPRRQELLDQAHVLRRRDGDRHGRLLHQRRRVAHGRGRRPEQGRQGLLRPRRHRSREPEAAVGAVHRFDALHQLRPEHRVHLRQPGDHQAPGRQVGGAPHLRLQQRRRPGLAVRGRPADRRDPRQGEHPRRNPGLAQRAQQDHRAREQLRRRQHRARGLCGRSARQRLEVRHERDLADGTVQRLAQVTDPGGVAQPITTRPEITRINTHLVLYVTTGEYLGLSDLATTQIQTVYAFKDTSTDPRRAADEQRHADEHARGEPRWQRDDPQRLQRELDQSASAGTWICRAPVNG